MPSEPPSPTSPPSRRWTRQRLHGHLRELHRTLRTEGDTPPRQAAAVALGAFIGCTPIYGTHLLLCLPLARLFRLNRLVTYLAAHINNPLTAPWLLAFSYGLGHRFFEGAWPPLSFQRLVDQGAMAFGRDLLVGSLILGSILAPILGLAAYAIARRRERDPEWSALVEATALRYGHGSPFDWEFVRGKLRGDPVYRALLDRLASFHGGRLVDLGCGRGIAMALLHTARSRAGASTRDLELFGIEGRPRIAGIAARALEGVARIEAADLAAFEPPRADRVLLIDVLHYLDAAAQEDLVRRVLRNLSPGGAVYLREADAGAGMRFVMTRAGERLAALLRGRVRQRFHYRSAADWMRLFETAGTGLRVSCVPAREGTPFGNVLIEAARPEQPAGPSVGLGGGRRRGEERPAGAAPDDRGHLLDLHEELEHGHAPLQRPRQVREDVAGQDRVDRRVQPERPEVVQEQLAEGVVVEPAHQPEEGG
ncbi:MAG TPA: DUF2062 domain-containing protein [Verrucomicrobiae bacterium]|nr:DUF2062 domain-containing protein [Verrucomicrobiae bacterium]